MNSSTVLREALCDFRTALYRCFDRRSDALFEISDALLTAGPLPSPVHLSLEAVHRRGWGSFYAALARGRNDVDALRALVMRHPLDEERPVYAVDASVWARSDAETSPARGFYYHPSRHSAGQPIVAGWAYQWIAQLGFTRDSWSAPVDVRRRHPSESASLIAAEQIKTLLRHRSAASPAPLFVFDAGYDPVQLAEALAGVETAILVRLRSERTWPPESRSIQSECNGVFPWRTSSATLYRAASTRWRYSSGLARGRFVRARTPSSHFRPARCIWGADACHGAGAN